MSEAKKTAEVSPAVRRAFEGRPPGRLMNRGHPVGDFLEAWAWDLLEERRGFLVESQLLRKRGRTCWVQTRFTDEHGALLANAHTTLREGCG
jgi:PAS domain-containing protein